MVSATDLKFYRSSSGTSLGGDISGTQIISATKNNLFVNVTRADQVSGATHYMCMYLKNTSAETIGNVTFWQTAGTPASETSVNWGLEPTANSHKYRYAPWMEFNGTSTSVGTGLFSNVVQFSISAWFKTSASYTSNGYIISKGIEGSEAAADNYNFKLNINSAEQISGGFEEVGGTDHFATSPLTYNDGFWHFVVVTYDLITIRLYIDGVQVATHATTTTPNTSNLQDITIGSDSAGTTAFFDGQIDEVRLWGNDLSSGEVTALYEDGEIPQVDGLIYENKFGGDNNTRIAQVIPNITTEPAGISWHGVENQPISWNIASKWKPGGYKPIWIKWRIDPDCPDIVDDRAIFNFTFDITTTGTSEPTDPNDPDPVPGGNPPPAVTNFKIAAVSDWGEESETDDVVDMITDGDYDLIISSGDNAYTSDEDNWYDDILGSLQTKFKSAAGNHDSSNTVAQHNGFSKSYGSFDFQNIHVLILDTESDMEGSQLTFAENDLEAQSNRSNIDWIFVAFHRPAIGPDSDHANNEENQIQNYFDLFLETGVNLVLQAHNHIWFRSYPVKRNGSSVSRVITSSGPYEVGNPNKWFICATSGTGGHDSPGSLYSLDNTPSFSAYQNNSNNGILSIEASNNGQTLTCKFINTSGSTKHTWVMNI